MLALLLLQACLRRAHARRMHWIPEERPLLGLDAPLGRVCVAFGTPQEMHDALVALALQVLDPPRNSRRLQTAMSPRRDRCGGQAAALLWCT